MVQILSSNIKVFLLVLIVGVTFGSIFVMGIDEIKKPDITFTSSTDTICNNGVCNLILYSGIRNVYEDETWKRVEDARSLKGKGFNIIKKEDGTHKINVIDFNMTSISFNFFYDKDNLGEYEFELEEGKMKTKYKIVETFYNETTNEPYQVETEQEIEIEEDENKLMTLNVNPFGKEFHLGENSTTIKLQENDTENLKDLHLRQGNPNTNYGTLEYFDVLRYLTQIRRGLINFNLTSIPLGSTIEEAVLYLYTYEEHNDQTDIHQLNDINWIESQATWNSYSTGNNWDTAGGDYNATILDSLSVTFIGWWGWNVTNIDTWDRTNVSFLLKPDAEGYYDMDVCRYRSKEYIDDISLRPYLNITYTEAEESNQSNQLKISGGKLSLRNSRLIIKG